MAKDNSIVTVVIVGGVAYGLYWYLTNYGPNGAIATVGGLSYWETWFGGTTVPGTVISTNPLATSITPTGTTVTGTPSPVPAANATFTSSPGNNAQVPVGSPWSVSINGALPNSPVTVASVPATGAAVPSQTVGSTDANGNFSLSGTMPSVTPTGATAVGTWTQQWAVGGVPIGNWNYTITYAAGGGMSGVVSTQRPQPQGMSFGGNVQSGRGFKGGFGQRRSTDGSGGFIQ